MFAWTLRPQVPAAAQPGGDTGASRVQLYIAAGLDGRTSSRATTAEPRRQGIMVNQVIEDVTRVFEVAGVLIIALGALVAAVRGITTWRRRHDTGVYLQLRRDLGRSILLGLEILVAADIVRTVAIAPTLANVLVLGVIVLIRTFLSFSLDVEIDGIWPWQRSRLRAAATSGERSSGAEEGSKATAR